ncbi:MAG: hypothetical protein Q8N53_19080 [Longimicrobiales bacterium]|nr:hypothetical protein [Longimicrobiales bacterium]
MVLTMVCVSTAAAQSTESGQKTGRAYVGGNLAFASFNGEWLVAYGAGTGSREGNYDLARSTAVGVALGVRVHRGELEIAYSRASHDATLTNATGSGHQVTVQRVGLDTRFFLRRTGQAHPYILLAFGGQWHDPTAGDFTGTSLLDESKLTMSFGTGGGLVLDVAPRVSIVGGVSRRWEWGSVTTIHTSTAAPSSTKEITGTATDIVVAARFHF